METNDIKDRLKQAYHHLKGAGLIDDQKDLADKMGYSRTSISKALNGYEDYLTESFVIKLHQTFSNVFSKEWLLTGEGDMLKSDEDSKDKPHFEITNFKPKPYIDSIYATLGVPNGFTLAVKSDECEQISIPFVNDYDFSIRGRGDSMINRDNPQKSIGEGDIIACKLWNSRTHIRWGEVYCLATSDGVVIKKIMPADQEGYIKCVSYNEFDGYKPYELPLDEIHDWALVVSVIHISNW